MTIFLISTLSLTIGVITRISSASAIFWRFTITTDALITTYAIFTVRSSNTTGLVITFINVYRRWTVWKQLFETKKLFLFYKNASIKEWKKIWIRDDSEKWPGWKIISRSFPDIQHQQHTRKRVPFSEEHISCFRDIGGSREYHNNLSRSIFRQIRPN